ncbi:hypothetical protein B0H14DRAFT_2565201 [Mycena olivaceomarginata]|nr:hypothetical protein B0H14DRAFT_2565201 [Mycena olivaceomarginata]
MRAGLSGSGECVIVDPTLTVSRVYMYFYLFINVGALVGQITMPLNRISIIRGDKKCVVAWKTKSIWSGMCRRFLAKRSKLPASWRQFGRGIQSKAIKAIKAICSKKGQVGGNSRQTPSDGLAGERQEVDDATDTRGAAGEAGGEGPGGDVVGGVVVGVVEEPAAGSPRFCLHEGSQLCDDWRLRESSQLCDDRRLLVQVSCEVTRAWNLKGAGDGNRGGGGDGVERGLRGLGGLPLMRRCLATEVGDKDRDWEGDPSPGAWMERCEVKVGDEDWYCTWKGLAKGGAGRRTPLLVKDVEGYSGALGE